MNESKRSAVAAIGGETVPDAALPQIACPSATAIAKALAAQSVAIGRPGWFVFSLSRRSNRMPDLKHILLVVFTVSLLIPRMADASMLTTDTASAWNGDDAFNYFGEPTPGIPGTVATVGQTFTAPAATHTVLESFSLFMDDRLSLFSPDTVDFAFYVAAWDGAKAIAPLLYEGSAESTTNNGGSGGFEQFTFNTGGVPLVAGAQYVAFVSASNFFDGEGGGARVGTLLDARSNYSDGGFWTLNNGNNFNSVFTSAWSDFFSDDFDLAFTAEFSQPVPEPATLCLLTLGGLCLLLRRAC